MLTRIPNSMLTPFAWAIGLNGMALGVFAFSPFASTYPLAVLGIVAFLFVQVVMPACRPNLETPLCPGNLAQGFFWIQLVLVPILIGYFGVSLGQLPNLPSSGGMNLAIVLRVIGYLAFSAAYQCFCKPAPRSEESQLEASSDMPSPFFIIASFAVIGLIGWLLFFGGVGGFLEFASTPAEERERRMEATTLAGAAGNFMRHFLGFAIVWAWSVWIGGSRGRINWLLAGCGTLMVIALLAVANFNYNRGAMLAPALAIAAAYSVHVRRLSLTLVGVAGVVVLAGAFAFGWYRSTNLQITDLAQEEISSPLGDPQGLVDTVQIYASPPQMTAYLIDDLDLDNRSYGGSTLLPSVVYPIPVVGKPFRESSGVYIFNEMIYGDPDMFDQNIAYDAEMYMNFHVAGVAVFYFLLGGLHSLLQVRFLRATRPIDSYIWLVLSIWTVFPGSLPVLSQLCIYSFWPIYGYGLLKWLTRHGEATDSFTEDSYTEELVLQKG